MYPEAETLNAAITATRAETGVVLQVINTEKEQDKKVIDAILKIKGKKTKLYAEIKKWANHTNIGALINQMTNLTDRGDGVLVADYINPKMADKLKQAGVQFIDTAGKRLFESGSALCVC